MAGLRAPETRSPCTPGSVSVTVELDRGGQVDADDLAVVHREDGGVALLEVVHRVAEVARSRRAAGRSVSLSMNTKSSPSR